MKTPEQIAKFKAEIAAVCERHRIGMAGGSGDEGIYGEIFVFDMDAPKSTMRGKIERHHLDWDNGFWN